MADKQKLNLIKRQIQKDPKLAKLQHAFDSFDNYNLPIKDMYEEIERIHLTRKTRHLDRTSASFVQDITDGMLYDQASRSRLTELLMACIHANRNLSSAVDTLTGYLTLEYADLLSSIRTKGERMQFMESHVMSKYHRYMDRVSRVREAAELVITDIDKAGYVYKNLIETVKIASGRREVL